MALVKKVSTTMVGMGANCLQASRAVTVRERARERERGREEEWRELERTCLQTTRAVTVTSRKAIIKNRWEPAKSTAAVGGGGGEGSGAVSVECGERA